MKYIQCHWPGTVTCSHCQHEQTVNSPETEVCKGCGKHLVIYCRHCRYPTLRTEPRCRHCRRQLHRTGARENYLASFRKIPVWVIASMSVMVVVVTTIALVRIYEFDWEKAFRDDSDAPVMYDVDGNPIPSQKFKLP